MCKQRILTGLLLGLVVACASSPPGSKNDLDKRPAKEILPLLTQQMMNALPADSTIWHRYLSDQALYVGEDATIADKKELLSGFGPFPPGLSGSIKVANPIVREFGNTAVIVFEAHEEQTIYNQHITVRYLSTYTWHREDGHWRVISAQTLVVPTDPEPTPLDPKRLENYVGVYEVGPRRYHVERRGDALVGGNEGADLKPLIAVGDNVFTDAGNRTGLVRIFIPDKDGTVRKMVVRRKYADLVLTRVP